MNLKKKKKKKIMGDKIGELIIHILISYSDTINVVGYIYFQVYMPVDINPHVTFASAWKPVITQKPLDSLLQCNGGFCLDLLSPDVHVINSVVTQLISLHGFSAVSSYNVATQSGNWTLAGCCESSTVSPTMSPTVSPTVSTERPVGSPATGIGTDSVTHNDNPQGEGESINSEKKMST